LSLSKNLVASVSEQEIVHVLWRYANNSVTMVSKLRAGQRGEGVSASRPALGLTQPPIQWVPVTPFPEVKRPRREADHSPPCNAEVNNTWGYTFTPSYVFVVLRLVKQRKRLHGVVLS
jgi:hypothetical protein